MGRKKKQQNQESQLHTSIHDDYFYYCDNRECADFSCERWIKHAPFDEIIHVIRFELGKNGECKNRL